MKSIAIIGCYFGTLRKDTPLFIRSIAANPTINWIVFSDCDWGNVPKNIRIIPMSFEQLQKFVQSKFDFEISLEKPYKLCDFRPAYGYIFRQFVEMYDFWGHCDFDMIFGDLRKFITEDKLEENGRIYYQGHLSVYKNTAQVNKLFKSKKGPLYYKDVFTSPQACVFDEVDGIYPIFKAEGVPIYKEIEYIDIYPYLNVMLHPRKEYDISNFFPCNYRKQVFGYKNGKIYKWYIDPLRSEVLKEEYAYIHYSHKIFTPCQDATEYYFSRKGLIPMRSDDSSLDEIDIPFESYYPGIDEFRMNLAEVNFRIKRKLRKIMFARK